MDDTIILRKEKPQQCDLCGKIAELRPYGPNGECVCFECGMKNEEACGRGFSKRYALGPEGVEAWKNRKVAVKRVKEFLDGCPTDHDGSERGEGEAEGV